MLTADCPVGLRRIRRRLGIWAGLVIAAWLTICLFGLTSAKGSRINQVSVRASTTAIQNQMPETPTRGKGLMEPPRASEDGQSIGR